MGAYRQFMAQAQRAVTCTLADRAREARDAPMQLPSAEALLKWQQKMADNQVRAEELRRRVLDFGRCPRVCAPAAFTPAEELDKAIHAAMHGDGPRVGHRGSLYRRELRLAEDVVPAQMLAITHKPGVSWLDRYITGTLVSSPGDRSKDPLRRTSMLFVDGADRLLAVSDRERKNILQTSRTSRARLRSSWSARPNWPPR